MLTAITTEQDSSDAYDTLCRTLKSAAIMNGEVIPLMHSKELRFPDKNLWVRLEITYPNRFGCSCGILTDEIHTDKICEINPARENPDLTYGGIFAIDGNGNIYLCHTGNISIGKNIFFDKYRGKLTSIQIGDRIEFVDVIVIGRIDDHNLPIGISHFVHEVYRIKEERKITKSIEDSKSFRPEFSGLRRSYDLSATIESNVKHGPVVTALADAITRAQHEPCNDRSRDMFIKNKDGQMSVLFEIKTKTETTDIYQAVGQLMFHGRAHQSEVQKIFVIPDQLTEDTILRLQEIGIKILHYQWNNNGKPEFRQEDVDQLLP